MHKHLHFLLIALTAIFFFSLITAEARQKPALVKKPVDKALTWSVDIYSPSNAVYDAVSDGYFITDYGKYGYYPYIFTNEIDSSLWDGGLYFVSNVDHSSYKLPILLSDPSGCEIVGDTLYISDSFRMFLINLNNDSTIVRLYLPTATKGLTDMVKDTSGNLYISSFYVDSIFKYNIATRQFTRLQTTGLTIDSIGSMVFEPMDNAIYFGTYTYKSKIMKLDLNTMNVSLAKQTAIPYISGMDTDGDGNLLVAQKPRDYNNNHSPIIKFNRNFTGDSEIVIYSSMNYEINNIYYNKISKSLALTSKREHNVTFVNFNILSDTVKLVYPKDSAVNVETSIIFRFNKLKAADDVSWYEFIYNTSSDFSGKGDSKMLSSFDTSVVINNLDSSTTYYWQVIACNGKVYSKPSPIRMFTTKGQITAPTGIYPTDSMKNVYSIVNFRWTTSGNAKQYLLQIYSDKMAGNLYKELYVDTNAVTVDDLINRTTYYWMVKAVGDSGGSNWSRYYTFTTDTSLLNLTYPINPENGEDSIETNIDFHWRPVSNATHYIFKLCNKYNELITKVYLDTNVYTISGLDTMTIYHWFIKPYNSVTTGEWNPLPFQFSTNISMLPPPIINPVSPNGELVNVMPNFSWQNTGAGSYKFQLAQIKKDINTGKETPDFIHPILGNDSVSATIYQLKSPLANNTKYAWKIKAVYDRQHRSNWSEVDKFTTKIKVGVDENNINQLIVLSPNPFGDEIFIKLPENLGHLKSLVIYNLLGELMQHAQDLSYQENEMSINVQNLKEGLYLIRLYTDKGVYDIRAVKIK